MFWRATNALQIRGLRHSTFAVQQGVICGGLEFRLWQWKPESTSEETKLSLGAGSVSSAHSSL